jgi:hypothetical protein
LKLGCGTPSKVDYADGVQSNIVNITQRGNSYALR